MRVQKNIALVAHDNRKKDMVEWVEWNVELLLHHQPPLVLDVVLSPARGVYPDHPRFDHRLFRHDRYPLVERIPHASARRSLGPLVQIVQTARSGRLRKNSKIDFRSHHGTADGLIRNSPTESGLPEGHLWLADLF